MTDAKIDGETPLFGISFVVSALVFVAGIVAGNVMQAWNAERRFNKALALAKSALEREFEKKYQEQDKKIEELEGSVITIRLALARKGIDG